MSDQQDEREREGDVEVKLEEIKVEEKHQQQEQEIEPAPDRPGKSPEPARTVAEDKPEKKKKSGGGCFRKKPKQEGGKGLAKKETFYDRWGSKEIEPGVRISNLCKDDQLIGGVQGNTINTVWDMFKNGKDISPNGNFLGWRDGAGYKWHSYGEVARRVRRVAKALKTLGLPRQTKIGIYSGTKPDWVITALGLTSRSFTIVPLYDTLGADSCNYIINQVEMPLLFVDSSASAKKIIGQASKTPSLKKVIMFSAADDDIKTSAEEAGIELLSMEQFTAEQKPSKHRADVNPEGQENAAFETTEGGEHASSSPKPHDGEKKNDDDDDDDVYDFPTPDDYFVIMYTSGTTGDPKGVLHTHRSMLADVIGVHSVFSVKFGPGYELTKNDIALHYLPMAHAYGMLTVVMFMYLGASVGFFGGEILKLAEDAQALKPTFLPMVPRLMNRVYSKVMGELQKSGLKMKLFNKGYAKKKALLQQGIVTKTSFWDKLVFKKLQNLFGGRVWVMSVGSAPISPEVLEWWRVCFGAIIMEGYGQTECAAAATIAIGPVGGNVGHPLPCNYIKLCDAPDSGYFVKDNKGEVCIKGVNVMREYYKQPDKTAEALDEDGWLHTGDIGTFLEDGSLKIIDRKKNIFKLAQGEYIAPEKIENVYAMCPRVAQVFVDGNSLESFTVGVIVIEPTMAKEWAKANKVNEDEVATNPDYIALVLESILKIGKENKLNSLEQVKSICLTTDAFTVENDLITPTLKNKRPQLRKYFKEQIDALYANGPMVGGEGGGKAAPSQPTSPTPQQ